MRMIVGSPKNAAFHWRNFVMSRTRSATPGRKRRPEKVVPLLNDAERRDICLWFGWGTVLDYPTGPRAYLREALKSERRAEFLEMPRPKRKAILQFVIEEHTRRQVMPAPPY
jgi:hypothetical protein